MTFALITFLFLAQTAPASPAAPGIKMTIRFSAPGGLASERTEYIQADRSRTEYRSTTGRQTRPGGAMQIDYGPRMASMQRCDLGQAFDLNLDDRQYTATPHAGQSGHDAMTGRDCRKLRPRCGASGAPAAAKSRRASRR